MTIFVLLLTHNVMACPLCYTPKDQGNPTKSGIVVGTMVLLAVPAGMGACFFGWIYSIQRKSKK